MEPKGKLGSIQSKILENNRLKKFKSSQGHSWKKKMFYFEKISGKSGPQECTPSADTELRAQ